jgi:phosphoglycolate phosphatase-like HAD superfamily hydrolase
MKRIRSLSNLNNTITEISSIKNVLEHIQKPNSLVIFDVDKTLARTEHELGSEQWAIWLVKQKLIQGQMLSEAISSMIDLYKLVHQHIELIPVETETVDVINELKDRSIPVICLTGRPSCMADRTHKQLSNIGMSFVCPQEFDQVLNIGTSETTALHKGILCVGMADKGTAFAYAMEKLNYNKPDSIIFIDDKKECVDSLSLACKRKNISFTGLCYTLPDENKFSFDANSVQEQLEQLLTLISSVR